MKDIKTGDAFYQDQGLKKVTTYLDIAIESRYMKLKRKIMKRLKLKRWSNIAFYNYFLIKNAPK